MNTAIISVLASDMSFAERLAYGGKMLAIGMATVFSVLLILMIVLIIFKLFAYTIPNKAKAKQVKKPEPNNIEAPVAPPVINENNDEELIAVITAAIEAYNSANGSALPFKVVSYKRVRTANGWNSNIDSNNL